ncbi:MAG TPA: hypothetical protein VNQ32_00250 [Steroidobacteraceae bacterium]|nr:hypothetical protein [Steroidobacteraceae bacterium]
MSGIGLRWGHPAQDPSGSAAEELENGNRHQPQDHYGREIHCVRLDERQRETREDETQQGASCVTHECPDRSIQGSGQVEHQEGRNCAEHTPGYEYRALRRSTGGGDNHKSGQSNKAGTASKPIESVEHVECIDERNYRNNRERQREHPQRQVPQPKQVAKISHHKIGAVDQCHGGRQMRKQAHIGWQVETIVESAENDHESRHHQDIAPTTEARSAGRSNKEAGKHRNATYNRNFPAMGLAPARLVDQANTLGEGAKRKKHCAGHKK